jgi:carbonic anhydrase
MRILILAFLALCLSGCGTDRHWYLGGDRHDHSVHWSYEGEAGPEHWGNLSPDYRIARSGHQQSPIDIVSSLAVPADLAPLEFHYAPASVSFENNGHTLQHDEETGGWLAVGKRRYQLKQFHFHVPSEHTLDGESFEVEVHLVHEDAKGSVAVVGIVGNRGSSHPAFTLLHGELPATGATLSTSQRLDPTDFLPEDRTYYRYDGSFTTPPCTEGVDWFVLKQPKDASTANIENLRALLGKNNRPIQPLYDRKVDRGGGSGQRDD